MKKEFKKDTPEYEIMQSFMIILQKYYEPEDADEYWDEVVETMDKFCKYYKNSICIYLMKAVLHYLEDKHNGKLATIESVEGGKSSD